MDGKETMTGNAMTMKNENGWCKIPENIREQASDMTVVELCS